VEIQEIPTGIHPIEGVSLATGALIGIVERGPDDPVLLHSWAEYEQSFGGGLPGSVSYLSYAARGFFDNGGESLYVVGLRDARDGQAYAAALQRIESLDDVSLVAVPDEVRFATADDAGPLAAAVIDHCERLRNRVAVVSAPGGLTDISRLRVPKDSSYAAFYYPWVVVPDPLTGSPLRIPASGHVAGMFARVEAERGVQQAPANQPLAGVTGLEFPVTDAMQQTLNPRGVNCIRDFRSAGRGIVVWGARTMSSDPEWKYVNVRRLLVFLETSIDRGLSWVVFEPNGETLWNRVKATITNFLTRTWQTGALLGTKADEAFFVRIDRTTMTQDDIDNGRLVALVGVAPVKPAEFVIFRIGQWTADRRPDD
jgi:phage tail sheath protein FI